MSIKFDLIIRELNISNATLRNWLKTNCLVSVQKGMVTTKSYNNFKKNILGKSKLNQRSNKQYFSKLKSGLLDSNQSSRIYQSSTQYEQSLSIANKNKNGIYYTPSRVIDEMFLSMPNLKKTDTFLDPCCGTGNFLIKALEKGFQPQNIFGFDIDKTALKVAQNRFYKKTGLVLNQIQFFNLLEQDHNKKYNFIFTNPPWGYKFTMQQKITYANKFNQGIKVDSSALFVLLCLNMLKKNAYLAVLLPEAFFNIGSFKSVRKILLKKNLVNLRNHYKPFEGLQTKAYSFVVKNNKNLTNVKCQNKSYQHVRKQIDFIKNPNQIINFDTTQEEAEVISHLYSLPHQTLVDKAKWGLGIVTGNNNQYLKTKPQNNFKPIYRGTDIKKGYIKKSAFYISDDFSQLQQTANKNLYLVNKKIVYRFINSQLIFAVDKKQRYFLNSVNSLILNKSKVSIIDSLNITEEQLVFLMNTEIMTWLFQKIFNTHKVLKSDLEKLPIFSDFFAQCSPMDIEERSWIDTKVCPYTNNLNNYLNIEKHNSSFRMKDLKNTIRKI